MPNKNEHEKYCNCDECKKNEGNSHENIKCPHCKAEFSTKKTLGSNFKIFGLATAFVAGGYIYEPIADYPTNIQYAIIDSCVRGDSDYYYSREELKKKLNVCSCAFDKAKEDFNYDSFKDDSKTFMTLFKNSIKKCPEI